MLKIGRVAEAAGIPTNTLRTWIQRGHLVMSKDDRSCHTHGATRNFSAHTSLQAVVMAKLVKCGVKLDEAALASQHFAHGGDIDATAVESGNYESSRFPGCLYKDAETYLVVWHDLYSGAEKPKFLYECFPLRKRDDLRAKISMALRSGCTIIWLDPVISFARANLGLSQVKEDERHVKVE